MLIFNASKAEIIPICKRCNSLMNPKHLDELQDWICVNCEKKNDQS